MLTSTAVGFIQASDVALIRCRVAGLRLTWSDTKSLSASRPSSGRYEAPSSRATSSGTSWTSWYRIRHPEPLRPPRDRLADPPEADDPERRAVDVRSEQQQRPPRLPLAVADVPVALGQAPGRGHQERPGEVGGRLGQDARRVADSDPARGARRDVDVVEADRVVADHLQPRTSGVEERVVDLVGEQRQHPVATGDTPEQLVARRRQVVLPDVGVARGEDRLEPLVGDPSRDEDPRPPAHTRAATSGLTIARMRRSASSRFSCELA